MSTLRQAAPRIHAGPEQAVSVEKVYPAEPLTAQRARHLVTSVLRGWGLPALRPDAALVVTELIANAVAQGESAPPTEVLVRVSRTARHVVIEAGDHNPAGPPAPPRTVEAVEEHGRGLLVTCALAARFGWFRDGDWKIVWAALRIPAPAASREQRADRGQLGRAA